MSIQIIYIWYICINGLCYLRTYNAIKSNQTKPMRPQSLSIVGAICVLSQEKKFLNKRSELIARYRHRAKFKL